MTLTDKISSKLRRTARNASRDIACMLGLYESFYGSARGSRIMIYHGICKKSHLKFNTLFLTQRTFESHLRFYKKYFNTLTLDDYYDGKFSSDQFNICLTFDDGFANNYKYVLPLLEQYQIPATFFVTAIRAAGYAILWNDFLALAGRYGPQKIAFKSEFYFKDRHRKYTSRNGILLTDKLRLSGFDEKAELIEELYPLFPFKNNKDDEDYWLQMTPEQLKALAASPFATIGAHGYYHNDLSAIKPEEATRELSLSKRYLENITGTSVTSLAFPYGAYNGSVLTAAREAGFTQLLATEFNKAEDGKDPSIRERLAVNPFISVSNQMYATIKGSYE
ncbi:MAG: polysaccharide deacetylase family protein [Mucilaginibacter sp.]